MPLDRSKVRSQLKSKFDFSEDDSKDHIWFCFKIEGLPEIKTKVSRSGKQLSDGLCNMVAKQLRVPVAFFLGMINCTNSRDEYVEKVRSDPQPPFPDYGR